MKAIRVRAFGGPEVMRLEEVPDPRPGPRQVVVRVKAAGVNPVDTYIRSGTYPRKPDLPYTPGFDAGGVVESVGQGVTRLKAGDRVYLSWTISGAYADLALCDESQVHPLPARLTFPQGAAVNVPYATAYRALFQRAGGRPGESLLVHGASGGVGIAAVQIGRASGFTVLGTAGTAKGRDLVAREGAHHVLDHSAPGYQEQLQALTGGRGVDVILEMLANVNLGRDLGLLAAGGRVVVIGSRGKVEIDPRDAMGRDAAIFGMSLFNASPADSVVIHAALVAGLENGSLCPIVGREMQLQEAPRAHQAVLEPGAFGKIVLIP
ncbi:MAG TPA: NADPH:quinone reductase [Candidatus Polarisedimenticolia bacterium]|nr:NADPH:quinone reductase [Candidatus Polarisedimenticolia bacterium]